MTEELDNTSKVRKILLVEDNPGDVRLTIEAIKNCISEIEVDVASDGEQAIGYLTPTEKKAKPELILLDLNLPKKTGRDVLKFAKEHSELSSIPIIVLTTSKNPKDINDCYALGANCYLCKANELEKFMESINLIDKFWLRTARLAK